eukprot:952527_1
MIATEMGERHIEVRPTVTQYEPSKKIQMPSTQDSISPGIKSDSISPGIKSDSISPGIKSDSVPSGTKASCVPSGTNGFPKDYWEANYDEPDTMDAICNANEHADYIRALFALEQIEVASLADLGFGMGHLTCAFIRSLKPSRVIGIEPSEHVFETAASKIRATCVQTGATDDIRYTDILSWGGAAPP